MGRALKTFHLIPHTHWDREWYLSFDHFRVMLVHLMDDVLDLLERRPDHEGFLLDGQTIVAEDYLEIRPDRRTEIARHVADGRLSMGPWYVLPDTFLISGESIIRNLMKGRAQARSFGRSMDVGYIPDSFGHTAQIPQILRGFGIDNAIVWRGFGGEPGQEGSEYRWRSPDGSEVLMEHLSALGYSGAYFREPDPSAVSQRFGLFRAQAEARARTSEVLMLSGGDHHWPVDHLPEVVSSLNHTTDGEVAVVHSSLSRFMSRLDEEADREALPLVEGELRFGYRWAFNVTGGVYSSRIYLKQENARAQRRLERYLEPLDARSVLEGGRSQRSLIDHGWTYLLQNHPHDSICGCSIDVVHREMMTRFAKLAGLGDGVERFAWMALAPDAEGEPGDDRTIVFFNPSPFERDEVLECDVSFFKQRVVVGINPDVVVEPLAPDVSGFVIEDAQGGRVLFEILDRRDGYGIALNRYDYPAQSRVERFRIRLPLDHLPPLGLKVLRIKRSENFGVAADAGELTTGSRSIENRFIRVEVQPEGAFYVTDKSTGVRFGPLGFFEDGADAGDVYNYSPPWADRLLTSLDAADVRIDEIPGTFTVSLRVEGAWPLPRSLSPDLSERASQVVPVRFTTTASLTASSRHVSFDTTIDNDVLDHRLRVLFETGRRTNVHHADNAFAVIVREQASHDPADFRIEVPTAVAPMHRFVAVSDASAGAAVIADGLPEYELKHDSGGVLALTLLRCVGELGRHNLHMRPGGQGAWRNVTPEAQCLGRHRFRYAFLPLPGDWVESAGLINRCAESFLLAPLFTTLRRLDAGIDERPFLRLDPDSLVLSALKESQDGTALVVRIYNPTPRGVTGNVLLSRQPTAIARSNLEEVPQRADGDPPPEAATVLSGGTQFHDHWPPYGIHTYRLTFSDIIDR